MWKYKLPISKDTSTVNLKARAFTDDGCGQETTLETGYNMRGVMNSYPP